MKFLNQPSSGSYSNLTYSRNRNGQYVRQRAIPVNPGTTAQTLARARLTAQAQDWRGLTALQRTGWGDLGLSIQRNDSLGQVYTLTGFQAFCLVNLNKVNAGDAVLTDAPAYAPPDPLLTVTPTITAATFSIAYTPTPLAAGTRLFVSASPQRSPGRSFEGDTRLIAVGAAAGASPLSIFTAYQGRFGTPIVGNRIFVVVQRYFGGFVSESLITSAIVA